MSRILLLSRYDSMGASSRVRSFQYLPFLRSRGMHITVSPLFSDAYLKALYSGKSRWASLLRGYLRRLMMVFSANRYDLVIVEKEVFPFLPAVAERLFQKLGVRYLADYDDALFHRYDQHPNPVIRWFLGRKIDVVMRCSTGVIAGNEYLAERARRSGAEKVEVIPTVVDSERYEVRSQPGNEVPVIGWIGSPQTSRYLEQLLPVFESLSEKVPVRFVAVGANADHFEGTPVEVWPWSESSEVGSIKQFDIGIMPLVDSPWERGKCGYKLIQYFACGVPVVASAVGVNRDIVQPNKNGLLVDAFEEWEAALTKLLQEKPQVRKQMGLHGRELVETVYSFNAQAPRLLAVIERTMKLA